MQHSDNSPYTYVLSHLTCSAAVFGHDTNCSRTKLHVTPVSYRDSRTDSVPLSPVREIKQRATAGPTDITNRTSRGSLNNGSTAVAKCVCVQRAALGVTGLGFIYIYIYIYISCCVQIIYKFRKSFIVSFISLYKKIRICG